MDNIMFCAMTHNPQPLHLDEEFSKKTMYGQRLVNSMFTLGLVIGVTVGDTTLGTTLGNLGLTDVRFVNPVFHGDTIRAVTKITDKRESKSRPTTGIVTFEHFGFNQRDEEIAFCVRTGLMMKRPA
jgi:acyl dehydratase